MPKDSLAQHYRNGQIVNAGNAILYGPSLKGVQLTQNQLFFVF